MAKNDKLITYSIIGATIILIVYIIVKNTGNKFKTGVSSSGCYPFEEVHPTSDVPEEMWVSIIKHSADGTTQRPPVGTFSIGDQLEIKGTGSALDEVYTILWIWEDDDQNIGSFRVDKPAGYIYNFNATQGNTPVDMTFFGSASICKVD